MNLINIFKYAFMPNMKTPLGRWNIHNYKETTLKIKYANEDNCGVCSSNNIEQQDIIISPTNIIQLQPEQINKLDDKEYIYMMGFESVHIKKC